MSVFIQPVAELFRTQTRDSVEQASHYLEGMLSSLQRKNMERIEESVPGAVKQNLQQFISDSPWSHRAVMDYVALQAASFFGMHPDLCLLIDESCFKKKGDKSAGVARMWNGREGKVDICQVGVFGSLNLHTHTVLIDGSLYLPKCWVEDPDRCKLAGIPEGQIVARSKTDLALEVIKRTLEKDIRPAWVGIDAGYGKNTAFLQKIEDEFGMCFMADIQRMRKVWLECPDVENATCRELVKKGVKVVDLAKGLLPGEWKKITTRNGVGGPVEVQAWARQVWLWSGRKKDRPRKWWLLLRVVGGETKYALCNAPADTSLQRLAFMAGQRYFIERAFEDGKTSVGMAQYQVRKWLGWHHHMAMVMLGSFFLLKQRILAVEQLPEISVPDLVYVLNFMLPRRGIAAVNEDEVSELLVKRLEKKRKSSKYKRSLTQ